MKGTSNAPLILGIIGSVLMLPGLACAVLCTSLIDAGAAMGGQFTAFSVFGFIFGAAPIVTGFMGAFKGKTNPKLSFLLLLISGISAGIGWYFTAFTSIFHLAALILFVIGAIMAKVQKMEE